MTWQNEIAQSARTIDDLLDIGAIDEAEKEALGEILEQFPMAVTPYYLSLIDFSDAADPIRKIAIPLAVETDMSGSLDTSGEAGNTVVTGLQHKYAESALMLSTDLCATYCRHCFRKRLVGITDESSVHDIDAVRSYLSAHPEISNVLVSGGDALMNTNERLAEILEVLVEIPHLDFIRIATRTPVVLPSRITEDEELLALLDKANRRKQLFLATQFNHPREVTEASTAAVGAIRHLGIPVRNQAVLLHGVNDDAATLSRLLRALTGIGAEPYYVFQCRPVSGVKGQFQVPLRQGYRIVEEAKATQNGIGKAFRYCMSHVTGKIEILGEIEEGKMLFKYHEAKDRDKLGLLFSQGIGDNQAWLD